MSNVGKRVRLIDTGGLSCLSSIAERLLNATGVIVNEATNYSRKCNLYYFILDEPWKSIDGVAKRTFCSFDYRFEIIEDEEAAKPKEFNTYKLLDISAELQNLSRECIQMFKDKEMP